MDIKVSLVDKGGKATRQEEEGICGGQQGPPHHTALATAVQRRTKMQRQIMNVDYSGGEGMWLPKGSRGTLVPDLQELPLQGIFYKQKCTSA